MHQLLKFHQSKQQHKATKKKFKKQQITTKYRHFNNSTCYNDSSFVAAGKFCFAIASTASQSHFDHSFRHSPQGWCVASQSHSDDTAVSRSQQRNDWYWLPLSLRRRGRLTKAHQSAWEGPPLQLGHASLHPATVTLTSCLLVPELSSPLTAHLSGSQGRNAATLKLKCMIIPLLVFLPYDPLRSHWIDLPASHMQIQSES